MNSIPSGPTTNPDIPHADSVLDCMMWSSKFRAVRFKPSDGMAVLATGHVDVYAARGRYQVYVDRLEPEGTGALQLAYEQMVRKLRAEGLGQVLRNRLLHLAQAQCREKDLVVDRQ